MEEAVSLKKTLAKVLLFAVLEVGALVGLPISPDEIEQIMKLSGVKVEHVVRTDDGEFE
jgi:hypothetical protein